MNALVKTDNLVPALQMSEAELVKVLETSLYPGAAGESIKLVIGYCRAAGLDPLQKPVHIVPMWDSKAGKMRDVIMPGVGLYRTQAARTGQFAGMSEPQFGPMVDGILGGVPISYPEYATVTVKRALENGIVAEFTATEYWLENYAVKGGKEKSIAPNAMWMKRPRAQLAKCAAAQALRIAFPELGAQNTADEMEGKAIHDELLAAKPETAIDVAPLIDAVKQTTTDEAARLFYQDNVAQLAKDPAAQKAFKQAVIDHRTWLRQRDDNNTIDMPTGEGEPA